MSDRTWLVAAIVAGGAGAAWASTRAWGSWGPAVRTLAGVPAFGLEVWKLSNLPTGWQSALASFDFVAPKLQDGSSRFRGSEPLQILEAARVVGCGLQGWGYHYLRDGEAGAREGTAAGARAAETGIGAYYCNAEKEWLGVWGEPSRPDPIGAMSAFVSAFRAAAPGVLLIFNGLSGPKLPAHVEPREVELAALFDGWGPMVYGTSRASIAKKWAHGAQISRSAGVKFCPVPGTGRQNTQGSGFWGYARDGATAPGIYSLNAENPADWIAPFVGTGGGSMLLSGNSENPDLVTLARTLKTGGAIA